MIIANGCPRTGTHLVLKLLGMLGFVDSSNVLICLGKAKPLRARFLPSENEKIGVEIETVLNFSNDFTAHAHMTQNARKHLDNHKIITTFRDPRESAVSMIRWHAHRNRLPYPLTEANEEALIDLLELGYYATRSHADACSWVGFVRKFEGWRQNSHNTLAIDFKELGTIIGVRRIAFFVGVEPSMDKIIELASNWQDGSKIYKGKEMHTSLCSHLPGNSDWRPLWTPKVDRAWENTRGPELLKDMGYE